MERYEEDWLIGNMDQKIAGYSPPRVGAAVAELVAKMNDMAAGDEFLTEVLEDLRGRNQ